MAPLRTPPALRLKTKLLTARKKRQLSPAQKRLQTQRPQTSSRNLWRLRTFPKAMFRSWTALSLAACSTSTLISIISIRNRDRTFLRPARKSRTGKRSKTACSEAQNWNRPIWSKCIWPIQSRRELSMRPIRSSDTGCRPISI